MSEAHAALMNNNLHDRATLRVNGGVCTGKYVAVAAMLAEEFEFGTIAMISKGCIMVHACLLNMCPAGVISQKENLR